MLDRASWWPLAERLEVGQKLRTNHDCGPGRTLQLSRNEDGYRAWCHRCNDGGGAGPPPESIEQKVARINRMLAGDRSVRELQPGVMPVPQVWDVSEWPNGAAVWLYKAGLGRTEIGSLGIYYHPPSDRVVIPVGGRFYQARAYQPGRMPKYLGPDVRPSTLIARWGQAESVTLTEDLLSAIKVGMVGEGWAVLGTSVSDHMVAELMKRGRPVNLWLDPDAAGRKGAARIGKQLRAYGLTVRDILSARDPKLHTRSEIKEILNEPIQGW
jgi:hypothetical protein